MVKKRRKKSNTYFGVEEEKAVLEWQKAETRLEKEIIYQNKLYEPFCKMVEGSIQNYANPRSKEAEEKEELSCLMISHIYEQLHKYNPTFGHKAYSYFNTIANNFRKNYEKQRYKVDSSTYDVDNYDPDEINTYMKEYEVDLDEVLENDKRNKAFINDLCKKIRLMINESDYIKEHEIKVGEALIIFFKNYESIFPQEIDTYMEYTKRGRITKTKSIKNYAKNKIFYELKEITNLSDKEFRSGLKFYRDKYDFIKKYFMKNYINN